MDQSKLPQSFYFCGTRSAGHTHFIWDYNKPRSLVIASNGNARLRGTVFNRRDSRQVLLVDVALTGWVAPGKTPPSGSPKTGEILKSALVQNGGTLDTRTWGYWTGVNGTVTGSGTLRGWKLQIARTGPAAQIGRGANVKNNEFGMSTWFTNRVVSRGSNWVPGACGDINTNLTEDCLAHYRFTNGSKSSTDRDDCSMASPVVFGRTTHVVSSLGYAVMRDEDWAVSSSRSASLSTRAYIEIKIKPNVGKTCDLTQVCIDLARNKNAVSKVIDVRYDEDPGSGGNNFRTVVRSLVLPDMSTNARSFRRYCLNLSAIPNIEKETRIRLYIWGRSRFSTRGDTYLDDICLDGVCKDKVPQIKSIDRSSLPIVTSRCFTIKGCGFTNVTEVRLGTMVFKSKDPCDYGKGYFVVRNDEEMCFYPPLCKPGTFGLVLRDKNGRSSNVARVSLVTPSTFTQAVASRWDVRKPQTVWVYGKFKRPYYCIFASPFNTRSKVDGIIDLGIGNNFSLLIPWDGPGTTCYSRTLGTWPAVVKGRTIYFQTLVIDLDNLFVLPFRVTNVSSTRFF